MSISTEAAIGHPKKTRRRILVAAGIVAAIGVAFKPLPTLAADDHTEQSESAKHVHVTDVRRDSARDGLAVTLRVDPGYHINANPATFDYLIPTTLKFPALTPLRVVYPAPVPFRPKFVDEKIAVYQGTVVIFAVFAAGTLGRTQRFGGIVTVQACTDVICFPPADLPITVR